jgi:hypothetical protein
MVTLQFHGAYDASFGLGVRLAQGGDRSSVALARSCVALVACCAGLADQEAMRRRSEGIARTSQ